MAGEWAYRPFGEVCEHSAFGPRFSGELYSDDGNVATLRTTDISADGRIDLDSMPLATLDLAKLEQHVLRQGDLVITRTGRVGSTAVFGGFRLPVLPGAFLIRFRLQRATAEPHFYRYFFMSPTGQQLIESVAVGSVQKNLNITNLHRLAVPVPALREQQAIACILGALDDKIELNRRRNRTLEAMARAIFQSWFVDFDPVKAKASGRTPPGLKPEIAALFPDCFEDSAFGPIPAGWHVGTLNDVIAVYDSKRIPLSHRQREQRRGPYPYYGAAAQMDSVDDYLFDGVYVLMGEDGSVVKDDGTPVLQYVWGKFWVNNHAHVLQGTGSVSTEHLLLHLKTCNIIPFVTGAVQPKLNQGNMNRIGFTHAPESVNRKFSELITPLFSRMRRAFDETRTLATLRDTLIPKLLSGELRVPEAERIVGRTA